MANHIFHGIGNGLVGLVVVYAGFGMMYLGRMLVEGAGREAMSPRKAALVAVAIAAVLGFVLAQGGDGGDAFYLLDSPDIGEDEFPANPEKSVARRFFMVFVFCCGAMWAGIIRSRDR